MSATTVATDPVVQPGRFAMTLRYLRRNRSLTIGLLLMLLLIAFTVIGMMVIDPSDAYPLKVRPRQPPSWQYPFGTDFFGRDLTAAMVVGTWQTIFIGVVAGGLGTIIGILLGFTAAYFGGWFDASVRSICQILIPIPAILIQIVIAGSLDPRDVTVITLAWIIVLLAWMGPTLVIRAQVLTMKERQFVSVAKLSGVGDMGVIFKEIFPNLLPFVAAALVGQVFQAVFASFYLAVLGLGPLREPLLGNIIWAAQSQGAFFNGWWWWPVIPSLMMVLILATLALINMGLDELSNPRVRSAE